MSGRSGGLVSGGRPAVQRQYGRRSRQQQDHAQEYPVQPFPARGVPGRCRGIPAAERRAASAAVFVPHAVFHAAGGAFDHRRPIGLGGLRKALPAFMAEAVVVIVVCAAVAALFHRLSLPAEANSFFSPPGPFRPPAPPAALPAAEGIGMDQANHTISALGKQPPFLICPFFPAPGRWGRGLYGSTRNRPWRLQQAYRYFTRSILNLASAPPSGYSFASCTPASDTAARKEMWCPLSIGWGTET